MTVQRPETWLCTASREPEFPGICQARNLMSLSVCPVCCAPRPHQSSFRAALQAMHDRRPFDLEEVLRRLQARGIASIPFTVNGDDVTLTAGGQSWLVRHNTLTPEAFL